MKLPCTLLSLLLVLLVLVAVFIGNTESRKKPGKKVKPGVCKYERKGEEGPCQETDNTKSITLPLKKGDPATCQPTKVINKPCNENGFTKRKRIKGCKYDRKSSDWTDCDPGTREKTKVMMLKEGSNSQCNPTKTKVKKCGAGKKKASRNSRKDA